MLTRPLLGTVAALSLAGGLLAAGTPAASAAHPATAPAAADSATGMRAVVTAPVGGQWSVRFVDGRGTVLAAVGQDAIALVTAAGRVPADRVLSADGDTVELGTADPALTATVSVTASGAGVYAVTVAGHGEGITATSIDLGAPAGERYLGLGERSDAVDHRGRQVENRVLDGPYTDKQAIVGAFVPAPGYEQRADATYFPVPWVLSTGGYGVLVDDDEDSSFELATPAHPRVNRLIVASDHLDLRVFDGPTPARALARMTAAVGRQPAASSPTVYGAWWQPAGSDATSELSAQRRSGVPISVAQTYTHFLPCGGQDDQQEKAATDALHGLGVAVTAYVNPMVCTSYEPVYDQGVADGAFTRNPDGSPLVYRYSTASNFQVSQIDFSAPAGRDLFEQLLGQALADGYDGWMEDFGEYTPATAVSADGTPGATMHNRYVEQYHATARDFEAKASRPLLRYNRSGWTDAIKESSIVWGGDPTTTWGFDGLTSSVREGLTMGTSGISTWGPDIGGYFTGPGEPQLTAELLDRWIEYGAFTGVMRLQTGSINIGAIGTKRPQVTDADVAPVWKRYTRLRTMLYPYIAGSQDAYQRTGLPLMRQLALAFPGDRRAVATDDEYLFGSDLLVAPVTSAGAGSRKVYLPRGRWIELARAWRLGADGRITLRKADTVAGRRTVTATAPRGTIPLFLRAGAVVPLLPRSVDTLSSYGTGVVRLADRAGRRTLLAAPQQGHRSGALGAGETLTSQVSGRTWTLRLDASRSRTYDVQATLAGLGSGWTPCRVTAGGKRARFAYDAKRRVLTFAAHVAARGTIRVTACRS